MNRDLYANNAARLDTIIGDAGQMWSLINLAYQDYNNLGLPKEQFNVWLEETYGVKLQFTPQGELKVDNQIVDNYKYLIFLLKFDQ